MTINSLDNSLDEAARLAVHQHRKCCCDQQPLDSKCVKCRPSVMVCCLRVQMSNWAFPLVYARSPWNTTEGPCDFSNDDNLTGTNLCGGGIDFNNKVCIYNPVSTATPLQIPSIGWGISDDCLEVQLTISGMMAYQSKTVTLARDWYGTTQTIQLKDPTGTIDTETITIGPCLEPEPRLRRNLPTIYLLVSVLIDDGTGTFIPAFEEVDGDVVRSCRTIYGSPLCSEGACDDVCKGTTGITWATDLLTDEVILNPADPNEDIYSPHPSELARIAYDPAWADGIDVYYTLDGSFTYLDSAGDPISADHIQLHIEETGACGNFPSDCEAYVCYPVCLVRICGLTVNHSTLFMELTDTTGGGNCCLPASAPNFTWGGGDYYSGKIGDATLTNCGYFEVWYYCDGSQFKRKIRVTDLNGGVNEYITNDPGGCVGPPPEFEDEFDIVSSVFIPLCGGPFNTGNIHVRVFTNNAGGSP